MNLLILLLSHYIGDYALQSEYIASEKGKDQYVLLAHVAIWTFVIVLTTKFLGFKPGVGSVVMILALPHYVLDYIKSRNIFWCRYLKSNESLMVDQLGHMIQLFLFFIAIGGVN
jgi:hypothetical protein